MRCHFIRLSPAVQTDFFCVLTILKFAHSIKDSRPTIEKLVRCFPTAVSLNADFSLTMVIKEEAEVYKD